MDKGRLYEAAVCEVKRNNKSLPKTLYNCKPDCVKTDGVYAFNMPYRSIQSLNAKSLKILLSRKAPARSRYGALPIILPKSIYDECCNPIIPYLRIQSNS